MIYSSSFYAGLKPDPPLKVSEWADKNRQLSTMASSEPGRWRTKRTPYLGNVQKSVSNRKKSNKLI